jgi:rubrerythrin
MHAMTAENLGTAFGGESMAHVRYKLWAKKAQQDGFANVARLFTAISFAEEVHASKHFNCGWTIEGEAPEKCPLCAVGKERLVEYAS